MRFSLATKIDRNEYGVSFNARLPHGGRALAYGVTLLIEPEFIAAQAAPAQRGGLLA